MASTYLPSIYRTHGSPLRCSCLENPRAGGACWAAVCGAARSRTRLTRLSSSSAGYILVALSPKEIRWDGKSRIYLLHTSVETPPPCLLPHSFLQETEAWNIHNKLIGLTGDTTYHVEWKWQFLSLSVHTPHSGLHENQGEGRRVGGTEWQACFHLKCNYFPSYIVKMYHIEI